MSAERFTVTIDIEYLVEDQVALAAASAGADARPDQPADLVAHLLESKITAGDLDVTGARAVGHSLSLPG